MKLTELKTLAKSLVKNIKATHNLALKDVTEVKENVPTSKDGDYHYIYTRRSMGSEYAQCASEDRLNKYASDLINNLRAKVNFVLEVEDEVADELGGGTCLTHLDAERFGNAIKANAGE